MSQNLHEPQNRQRLRPWLEAKINSGQFPGLDWVDKNNSVFKIPWKHGGKQDWSESDSLIFKEWAVHTGRYRDGIDSPDWPSWKTRLRCALNKLPDIQEIKDMSNLDGSNPFRVYKFLPKKDSLMNSDINYRRNGAHRHNDGDQRYQPQCEVIPSGKNEVHSNIPKTVAFQEDEPPRVSSLGSDLGGIDVQDLIHLAPPAAAPVNHYTVKEEAMDTGDNLIIDENPYPTNTATGAPPSFQQQCVPLHPAAIVPNSALHQLLLVSKSSIQPNLHEMILKLKYRHTEVASHHLRNIHGCRLFYGTSMDGLASQLQTEMFGSPNLEQLRFPHPDSHIDNIRQRELTQNLLDVLDRGLILETKDGDIYATRKCRLVIFVSDPHEPGGHPIKLQRNRDPVMVFDYNTHFLPRLKMAIQQGTSPPMAEFLIGFGQDWKSEKEPYNNLLISATLFHAAAYHQLQQLPTKTFISGSDDYDRYLENFRQLGLEAQQ